MRQVVRWAAKSPALLALVWGAGLAGVSACGNSGSTEAETAVVGARALDVRPGAGRGGRGRGQHAMKRWWRNSSDGGGPLFALAREARRARGGRRHWPRHEPPALPDETEPQETLDAGALQSADAGSPYDAGLTDAGSVSPEPAADGGTNVPDVPQPPAPLPRDVVARAALPIHGLEGGQRLTEAELWERIAESPATCFGETHTEPAHHYAQLRALEAVAELAAQRGQTFAVGFEMFQRPFQAALDAFVAGQSSEEQFLTESEYRARWGADFSLYRPLLEGARSLGLPALALNARTEITRKIGRTGIASLSPEELAELPELDLQDPVHREFIFGLFGVLPEHAAESGLEDIYAAQTTWDETMAETAAAWLLGAGASARLLIFAGVVHCHTSAIPARITRRSGLPVLGVGAIFESQLPTPDYEEAGYDLVVVLEDIEP